ncbi:YbhB/YbcL family Raf kinase inhibitor-like protein [Pseudanabaena sp. FACHB-2040]|uniref:YbhB/YbcL family Raf kinase inhibitor-like protein n=1 Tax=Pseudanabaena sp. FACHB-2040 TaxID=2692859 RepID=UPI0016878A67|nr:YbhB/YbcL family Raf kinase inhibitor-like protein [Pseudanabaena sp. FACHB-2040]
MHLHSPEFSTGGYIPFKYTCDGDDLSPPLTWDSPPEGTQSFALIVNDHDAPDGHFTHWLVYNLPDHLRELPEGWGNHDRLPDGIKQGKNDFGNLGFGGPCPPEGTHRYFFKLHALDQPVDLPSGATKEDLKQAMEGHVLSSVELMGRYGKAEF